MIYALAEQYLQKQTTLKYKSNFKHYTLCKQIYHIDLSMKDEPVLANMRFHL